MTTEFNPFDPTTYGGKDAGLIQAGERTRATLLHFVGIFDRLVAFSKQNGVSSMAADEQMAILQNLPPTAHIQEAIEVLVEFAVASLRYQLGEGKY